MPTLSILTTGSISLLITAYPRSTCCNNGVSSKHLVRVCILDSVPGMFSIAILHQILNGFDSVYPSLCTLVVFPLWPQIHLRDR